MNWLRKLERKFGKYAIPNLPLMIMICYGFGYVMNYLKPEWTYFVTLNPYAILHGQVWRLFTWVLVPEINNGFGFMGIFFVCIFLWFYYSIAKNLEMAWGKFMFNIFFFSGIIMTIVGAFLLFGYFSIFNPDFVKAFETAAALQNGECSKILGGNWFYFFMSSSFSTYYLNLSIFLAYALTYPNMRVLLFFIIPIKVKVLGIIYIIVLVFNILQTFVFGGVDIGLIELVAVGSSLLNVFVFFMILRNSGVKRFKEIKRQKEFAKKINKAQAPSQTQQLIRHKCSICGQTDVSNPSLTFRYCSKCNGNHEYCNEHLFTHQHIQ
ncbi:MAG: hypothetical protein MJ126_06580 [Lachnospiraceae bacterium]|nr:hypothetical protein [Lachnospiraceae bacterium]